MEAPCDWGQFDRSSRQDVLLVFVNAGDIRNPDWRSSAFDLEIFRTSRCEKKLVHILADSGNFETIQLTAWVTLTKEGLRGNVMGVLYYDVILGWQRLQNLLDQLSQVRSAILIHILLHFALQPKAIETTLRFSILISPAARLIQANVCSIPGFYH